MLSSLSSFHFLKSEISLLTVEIHFIKIPYAEKQNCAHEISTSSDVVSPEEKSEPYMVHRSCLDVLPMSTLRFLRYSRRSRLLISHEELVFLISVCEVQDTT